MRADFIVDKKTTNIRKIVKIPEIPSFSTIFSFFVKFQPKILRKYKITPAGCEFRVYGPHWTLYQDVVQKKGTLPHQSRQIDPTNRKCCEKYENLFGKRNISQGFQSVMERHAKRFLTPKQNFSSPPQSFSTEFVSLPWPLAGKISLPNPQISDPRLRTS